MHPNRKAVRGGQQKSISSHWNYICRGGGRWIFFFYTLTSLWYFPCSYIFVIMPPVDS